MYKSRVLSQIRAFFNNQIIKFDSMQFVIGGGSEVGLIF